MSDSESSDPDKTLTPFEPSVSATSTPIKRRGRPPKTKKQSQLRSSSAPEHNQTNLSDLISSSPFSVSNMAPNDPPQTEEPTSSSNLEKLIRTPLIHPTKFSGSDDVVEFLDSVDSA